MRRKKKGNRNPTRQAKRIKGGEKHGSRETIDSGEKKKRKRKQAGKKKWTAEVLCLCAIKRKKKNSTIIRALKGTPESVKGGAEKRGGRPEKG